VEVQPDTDARFSVLWLHGLGANGHDFEPIIPELGLDKDFAIRWVFPNAPAIPVTLNGGMVMPAWYDIEEADLRRRHDEEGIQRSTEQVRALLAREVERGIPSECTVLVGFSQGGAIALHTALRHPDRLLGIIGLSTYALREDSLGSERVDANDKTPVFLAHGSFDPMVPVDRGESQRDMLTEMGYAVDWHTYPMAHEVCLEEIRDLGKWFRARFEAAG
jgi:phospholipase/carboxylesterase